MIELFHEPFPLILAMSLSASCLILAVLALRLLLKRSPKWVAVLLWGLVAVKLICPIFPESEYSLVPRSVASGNLVSVWVTGEGIETVVPEKTAPTLPRAEGLSARDWTMYYLERAWGLGMLVIALLAVISAMFLWGRLATAVRCRDNIFQSENVSSPFIFGIVRPKIYLPVDLDDQTVAYVIAHERAHIRRGDHWWKLLGFLLAAVHWFNPLVWLAYGLLCRDIELACDEAVIRELDSEGRADYAQALVTCGVRRPEGVPCPLAFCEVGVKDRVKAILEHHKPSVLAVLLAVVACVAAAAGFLTRPAPEPDAFFPKFKESAISQAAGLEEMVTIYCPPEFNLICFREVDGAALAEVMEGWSWEPCAVPEVRLSSPGSVEFILGEDIEGIPKTAPRILLYERRLPFSQRRYAVIKPQGIGGEERYYSIDAEDYAEALTLVPDIENLEAPETGIKID